VVPIDVSSLPADARDDLLNGGGGTRNIVDGIIRGVESRYDTAETPHLMDVDPDDDNDSSNNTANNNGGGGGGGGGGFGADNASSDEAAGPVIVSIELQHETSALAAENDRFRVGGASALVTFICFLFCDAP
jgi:hypothetical protein